MKGREKTGITSVVTGKVPPTSRCEAYLVYCGYKLISELGLKMMLHETIRNDDFKIQDLRELGLQSEKLKVK